MKRILSTIFVTLILGGISVFGQWEASIDSILEHKDLSAALVSIQIKSLKGKVLYERNPNVGVMPASTLKAVTTLGALGIMGSKYQYKTILGYKGDILSDRTLYGDLIIVGSGDPSFGSDQDDQAISLEARLNEITQAIENKISCIEGKILIDATIFDKEAVHPGWAWDDLSNYYATGIWGLNIHENLYHLSFNRSVTPGGLTTIDNITPDINDIKIKNEVTVGPKGSYDEAYIYGDPYEWKKQIRGTIPPGSSDFRIKGAIPDSRIWFVELMKNHLQSKGINVSAIEVVDETIKEVKKLASLDSQEIRALAQHANEVSDNMYCDAFLKTIGAQYKGVGTWRNGQEGLKSYFKKSGIELNGYHQEDGSGLTMRNRVSASFMTDFLIYHANKLGVDELKYLLPQAGKKGSVKNFLNGYAVQPRAWLKSGSINAVVAYTGIIEIAPDQHVVLYVASNGHVKSNRFIRGYIERIIDTAYQGIKGM